MARGVEEALGRLIADKSGHLRGEAGERQAKHLETLLLIRYDVTFRDVDKLRDAYGLTTDLPDLFYFR